MKEHLEEKCKSLFKSWAGTFPDTIISLSRTASGRQYFRMSQGERSAIAAYGPDPKENEAFTAFSQHFYAKGLNVPTIYGENLQEGIYLQEDLGSVSLYDKIQEAQGVFLPSLKNLFQQSLAALVALQVEGDKGLDYTYAYPRASFDAQSMSWDLNHFKYFFVKLSGISFEEQSLEKDFDTLIAYLSKAESNYFMFRDFQSRNIMIKEDKPYFIDYQGGRKGPLQYDLASLLYQPKAQLPFEEREQLVHYYLDILEQHVEVDRTAFLDLFYGFVLIRRLQAFGTYGLRGLHERLSYFENSIPLALEDLQWVIDHRKPPIELPEIYNILALANQDPRWKRKRKEADNSSLTVTINSFSYKFGIPKDDTGNGGGFVFDCRFIHNPGRYEPYKKQTGRDQGVIDFLLENSNMQDYLNNIYHIVDEAVENYMERKFSNLMVNFGCTGGQHRSVYAADQLALHIKQKYGVKVKLKHIRQEEKNWIN